MPISVNDWEKGVEPTPKALKADRTATAQKKDKRPPGCTIEKSDVPFYPCPFGKPGTDCIGKAYFQLQRV